MTQGSVACVERRTWTTTISKGAWGPGPWQYEPDKEQWPDPATGYACLLKRNRFGALCGYVGVPQGHPWHGKGHDEVAADAHGGLTYSGLCQDGPEDTAICHIPSPGEPEPLWWLGFDCGHCGDYMPEVAAELAACGASYPGMSSAFPAEFRPVYRTAGYVKAECARLAEAARAVSVSGEDASACHRRSSGPAADARH